MSKFTFDPVLCLAALDDDLRDLKLSGASRFAADALRASLLKKFEPIDPSVELADRAKLSFRESNRLCSSRLKLSASRLDLCRLWASADFADFPLDWETIFRRDPLRCGPGASVLSLGMNSHYEKNFCNPWTTTSVPLALSLLRVWAEDPTLLKTANSYFKNDRGSIWPVKGSKLSTVPKNDTTDRTICTEPFVNMKAQLIVGDYINDALSLYGYDAEKQQDRNRAMARDGSISGHWATIDLKNASDMISLELVKSLLPGSLFAAIIDCRSSVTYDGEDPIPLFMVSSMGNGFTFPLETYIFTLALRLALYEYGYLSILEKPNFEKLRYGVFGDDIVCPQTVFDHLCSILTDFGFIVNQSKSFADGPFRESCGGDFYHGVDVRGVYLKRLRNVGDFYSACNRLMIWSSCHNIDLRNLVTYLLPVRWFLDCVPPDEDETAGIKVPSVGPRMYYKWQPRLSADKLDDSVNPFGAMLCKIEGLLFGSSIPRRFGSEVRLRRTLSFTPEWQHCFSANLHTLQGNERLNHRFYSNYTTGIFSGRKVNEMFRGVDYVDWAETVNAHIDCARIVWMKKPLRREA